ncbi:MAG TPA: hypothetical protein PKN45_11830, partial [Candidatus Limiplasma sp.]|nr:hypothetical protein [Candidatus Limiplasma sp.]
MTGTIPVSALGVTMMHEHFLWDQSCWLESLPADPKRDAILHEKISMENRAVIATYYPHGNLDNIINKDINLTIEEAAYLKRYGGSTVLECSNIGLGRDSEALIKIAEATRLHVIMGSGFYVAKSH